MNNTEQSVKQPEEEDLKHLMYVGPLIPVASLLSPHQHKWVDEVRNFVLLGEEQQPIVVRYDLGADSSSLRETLVPAGLPRYSVLIKVYGVEVRRQSLVEYKIRIGGYEDAEMDCLLRADVMYHLAKYAKVDWDPSQLFAKVLGLNQDAQVGKVKELDIADVSHVVPQKSMQKSARKEKSFLIQLKDV